MIHRTWDEAVFLGKNNGAYVFGNKNTKVVESYGRSWRTKEAAILFFYENNWFNVIGQLKGQGIYYYCNIASPFIVENNIIKYIDYDLDLRVFPTFKYKTLDRNEYNLHKVEMNYPENIQKILEFELENLASNKRLYEEILEYFSEVQQKANLENRKMKNLAIEYFEKIWNGKISDFEKYISELKKDYY